MGQDFRTSTRERDSLFWDKFGTLSEGFRPPLLDPRRRFAGPQGHWDLGRKRWPNAASVCTSEDESRDRRDSTVLYNICRTFWSVSIFNVLTARDYSTGSHIFAYLSPPLRWGRAFRACAPRGIFGASINARVRVDYLGRAPLWLLCTGQIEIPFWFWKIETRVLSHRCLASSSASFSMCPASFASVHVDEPGNGPARGPDPPAGTFQHLGIY